MVMGEEIQKTKVSPLRRQARQEFGERGFYEDNYLRKGARSDFR